LKRIASTAQAHHQHPSSASSCKLRNSLQLNRYAVIAVRAIFYLHQFTVHQERHFVAFISRSTTVQHEVKSSSTYRVQQELVVSNVLYRVQQPLSNQGFIYSRNSPKGMLFTHVRVTTLIVCFEKRAGVAGEESRSCWHICMFSPVMDALQ